jgi:hypothetical protein
MDVMLAVHRIAGGLGADHADVSHPTRAVIRHARIHVVAAAVEFYGVDLQTFTQTCSEVGLIFRRVSGRRTAWTPPGVLMFARMPRRSPMLRTKDRICS